MSDFRTLPVDEAVTWIRAWTDHTWPITLPQAFAIRDTLGWIPSPQEPRYFTTKLSTNGKEDGIILQSNKFGIKGIHFNLSSIYSFDDDEQINRTSHIAYSQYVAALTKIWGPGQPGKDDEAPATRWSLPNGVSVSMLGLNGLISVDIDSPWVTRITDEYERVMEKHE